MWKSTIEFAEHLKSPKKNNSSSAEYILISGNLKSCYTEPGSPIPVPTTTKFGSFMVMKKNRKEGEKNPPSVSKKVTVFLKQKQRVIRNLIMANFRALFLIN